MVKSFKTSKLQKFWIIGDKTNGRWVLAPKEYSPESYLLCPPDDAHVFHNNFNTSCPQSLSCCLGKSSRSFSSSKMGFCSCSVKYLLFLFNFFVVLCGIAVIAVGIMTNTYGYSLKTILAGHVTSTSIILIVIGAIVFLIAFFGCCGALRESSCMITTYAVFLLTILIIEIAVGAIVFVYRAKFEEKFKSGLQLTFQNYNADEAEKETVDIIQQEFKCCGIEGPSSWVNKVPKSCCQEKDSAECHPYSDGCIDKVASQIKDWLQQLGGIAIGVACIEIFGVIFACFLASSIRNKGRREYV